jgi:hypothetical protein
MATHYELAGAQFEASHYDVSGSLNQIAAKGPKPAQVSAKN